MWTKACNVFTVGNLLRFLSNLKCNTPSKLSPVFAGQEQSSWLFLGGRLHVAVQVQQHPAQAVGVQLLVLS